MSAQPITDIPAPLPAEKFSQLTRLVEGLDAGALLWVSGYAAGLARSSPLLPAAVVVAAPAANPQALITVLYGTQTGNSRLLAERLKAELDAAGLPARLLRASAYTLKELKQERCLLAVISTKGDVDPPDDARALMDFIASKKAPALAGLSYAVLALGDSSYPKYCSVGRSLDARLAELGGTRLAPLTECDLDFEPAAAPWIRRAGSAAQQIFKSTPALAAVTPLRRLEAVASNHDRRRPFTVPVLTNQRITARDADKDVRHIELGLSGAGVHYEPGDSIGILPRNPAVIVAPVLAALKLDADAEVTRDGRSLPLARWLTEELEITRLSRPLLSKQAELAGSDELKRLLTPEGQTDLGKLLREQQLVDVLRRWPARWDPQELVTMLRGLTPRLYSIASSRKAVEDEAHLTVSVVDYEFDGLRHHGPATAYLAATDAGELRVFLETNTAFRLPADGNRDVVMIGPGTGVAPFRAFVQERAAVGASGRNWLFFGERNFRSTFLYQTEWQEALKRGQLDRIDLAFSRDQAEKIYVQHRIAQQGRDLYQWLEGGAHVYVCGDALRMAKDVHEALLDVVATHGGRSREQAQEYLGQLQQQGRYARDIY
jgi:sulfite reductase (NADPH) flavoprotein alpha-component